MSETPQAPPYYNDPVDKATLNAAIKNLDDQGVVIGGMKFSTYIKEKFPENIYISYAQGLVQRFTDLFDAQRELDKTPSKDAQDKADALAAGLRDDFIISEHVQDVIIAAEKKDVRVEAQMVGQLQEYADHKAALSAATPLPLIHEGKTDSVLIGDVAKQLSAHSAILSRMEQSLSEAGFLPDEISHLVNVEESEAKQQADKVILPDLTPLHLRNVATVTRKP